MFCCHVQVICKGQVVDWGVACWFSVMWKAEAVPALGQHSTQLPQSSEAPSQLMSPCLVGVSCHLVTLLSPRLLLTYPVAAEPELLLAVRLSWSSCGSLIRQNHLLEPRFESRYPGHYGNSCLSPTAASLSQLSFPVDSLFHFSFLWRKGCKAPPLVEISPGLIFFVFLLPVQSRHSW